MTIHFGTSGCRAVVANEFSAQVGGVTDAIWSKFADISQKSRSMIVAHDTRVGFKFIGELINEDKIILGREESAGLSIKGHYPEKDGILACLLAAEAVAARRASLTDRKVREIRDLMV